MLGNWQNGKTALRYLITLVLLDAAFADFWPKDGWRKVLLDAPTLAQPDAPVDFRVKLMNGKSTVNQLVRIDPAQQTESFHVLPYDAVDESVILHDFNKNWTLILLPKKSQCFFQQLSPGTPPPQQLKSSIQRVIDSNGTNSSAQLEEISTWKVKSILFNRNLLTPKMQRLCKGIPIYTINRLQATLTILGPKRIGRSPSPYIRSACGGRVCNWIVKWVFSCTPDLSCAWQQVRVVNCQDIQC
ncbi:uncharacterized protein LOC116604633 isoform X2 [Nematostella vectensis]|uniref:uncharacterized protein LOC116604633 isoform X2 n=1 Tax=Nematostella vectensis TaxID=45351 RepID=UPI00138FB144|nr:uncharacterized protein LOC116604633 isoform X2 [Nematostella vectensis]